MIVITGATGNLGRLVIDALRQQGTTEEIVAAVRLPEKASSLRDLGITIRQADYNKPETLTSAFRGAHRLLLISSNELEHERIAQHAAVIDAAKVAGVQLLAYTSILRADTSTLSLAVDHRATEKHLVASGIPFVLLRNGWYFENHTEALAPALQHGSILGAAGEGRFASAARADYAAAAAKVLTSAGHENKLYELAGDTSYTLGELAAVVSEVAARPVTYHNVLQQEFEESLVGFGLPASLAAAIADADAGASQGQLDCQQLDLSALLGRPTVSLTAAVQAALRA